MIIENRIAVITGAGKGIGEGHRVRTGRNELPNRADRPQPEKPGAGGC